MKQIFLLWLAMASTTALVAQTEMKEVWEVKVPHRTELNELDDETGLIVTSSEKEISLVDAKSGKIIWTNDFKSLSNGALKKVDERIPLWDAKAIFLFDRKKMGADQMVVIDLYTGKQLWRSEKYEGVTGGSMAYVPELDMFAITAKKSFHMIKAKTGEEIWESQGFKGTLGKYIYNATEKTITALSVNPLASSNSAVIGSILKAATAFGAFKSQLTKFNVTNGDILWQTEIKGVVEREIKTNKIVAKMKLVGEKLFLTLQGLQVYDYSSGSLLWSVVHDETVLEETKRGIGSGYTGRKLVKSAVYNAVAEPLVDGNDVYLFDMAGKNAQYVSKYDLQSGKLIWKSKELKRLTIAPNLYKVGGNIIIQIGGWAEVQGIVEEKQQVSGFGGGSSIAIRTYEKVRFFKAFGPFGVEALNATNGEFVWRSERFAKGVTNAFVHNNELVVASGKELYNLNPENGTEKYEVSIKEDDIKETEQIFKLGNNAIIVCGKGVSSHQITNGTKNWVVKTKRGDLTGVVNGIAFYATEKSDQVAIDLNTGKYTTFDARKDSFAEFTDDGEYIFVFEKDKITKAKTRQ
jgi:outer membrane protein assembly factor BamB